MKIVVEKYGGTSVGSIYRIKKIAKRIVDTHEQGYRVAVVVSAMGGTTDELIEMAEKLNPNPARRELSLLLSTGEVVSCSLLTMAIQALGKKATALTGAQCGICTRGSYDDARITTIDTSRIKSLLEDGQIVVVAGYQGRLADDITVLGRGGSDASAVALAAALNAYRCRIYTDVNGVYTADPRVVIDAALLSGISYEEMIELAEAGAQVIMGRAVEIARKYGLEIMVGSSFENVPGTIITKEEKLEAAIITGVAANTQIAMIDVYDIKIDSPDTAKILGNITGKKINIILLSANNSGNHSNNISIVIKPEYVEQISETLQNDGHHYKMNRDVAKISIVGSGIANNYGVAYGFFDVLAKNGIEVLMTSTSEIKIAAIVPKGKADLAVEKLHKNFDLSNLKRKYLGGQNE